LYAQYQKLPPAEKRSFTKRLLGIDPAYEDPAAFVKSERMRLEAENEKLKEELGRVQRAPEERHARASPSRGRSTRAKAQSRRAPPKESRDRKAAFPEADARLEELIDAGYSFEEASRTMYTENAGPGFRSRDDQPLIVEAVRKRYERIQRRRNNPKT
jgi:hypothetical protein